MDQLDTSWLVVLAVNQLGLSVMASDAKISASGQGQCINLWVSG